MKKSNQMSVLALFMASWACSPGSSGHDGTTGTTNTTDTSGAAGTTGTASTTGTAGTTGTTGATETPPTSSGTTVASCTEISGEGECDLGCQDCPDGEKCVVIEGRGDESDQIACRPLPEDPKAPGEGCTFLGEPVDNDDCQRGSVCVDFPLSPEALCREFCKTEDGVLQCSDETTRCLDLGGKPVCATVCDPRELNECDYGCRAVDLNCFGCFPMSESGTFTCWYPPPEKNPVGLPCPFGECEDTLFCGPPGRVPGCDAATPCCTTYCDIDQPSCPDEGTQCEAIFVEGKSPQGLESLGACLTPK